MRSAAESERYARAQLGYSLGSPRAIVVLPADRRVNDARPLVVEPAGARSESQVRGVESTF